MRRAPRSLAPALDRFVDAIAPATTLARVQESWQRALGDTIADAARPAFERDGVVTVLCESSVWAHELELMAREIVARLNAALAGDHVRELRCRVG